jgi:hypothetical protein
MTSWVGDNEGHVEHFEEKAKHLGFSIDKSPGTACDYTHPEVARLWSFYEAGVMRENNIWQQDYA